MNRAIDAFGQADQLEAALGLDDVVGPKLASIILFAANTEYHLERAIWILEGIDPKGSRPRTDGWPITQMIAMVEQYAVSASDEGAQAMLKIWCAAARSGFIIRNNIAHGVSHKIGRTLVVFRNPRWHGEIRRREFGDLWCEPDTLDLIRGSFATLLRVIVQIAQNQTPLSDAATSSALRALREARSILGEFADQFYNPSFEKY